MKIVWLIAFVIVGSSQIFARPRSGRSKDDSLEEFKEYMNDYYLNMPLASNEDNETTDGDYMDFLARAVEQLQDTSSEEVALNEDEELVSNDSKIIAEKEISTVNEPLDDPNYYAYQISNDGIDDESVQEGTETITENDDLSSSAQVSNNKDVEHISTENTAGEEVIKETMQGENDITDNDDEDVSTMGTFFYPPSMEHFPPLDHHEDTEIVFIEDAQKESDESNESVENVKHTMKPLPLEDPQKKSDKSEESNKSVENVKPTSENPETEEEGNEETVKEENDDTDENDQHTSNSSWNDGNEFRFVADIQEESNEEEEEEDIVSAMAAFLFVPDTEVENEQEEVQYEDDDDWLLDNYDENEDDEDEDEDKLGFYKEVDDRYDDAYDEYEDEPEIKKVSTIDLSGNTDLQITNTDNNYFGLRLPQLAVSSSNSQLLANEHERNLKEFTMAQKHLNDNLIKLNAQNEKLLEKFSLSANEHSDYNGQTHRDIEEEMNEMLKSVDQIKARIVEMQKLEQTNNYHMLLNALLKELYGKTL